MDDRQQSAGSHGHPRLCAPRTSGAVCISQDPGQATGHRQGRCPLAALHTRYLQKARSALFTSAVIHIL